MPAVCRLPRLPLGRSAFPRILSAGYNASVNAVTCHLTASALEGVLVDFLRRGLPHRRLSRLAGLLLLASNPPHRPAWRDTLVEQLFASRLPDGGWVDCEDTAWSAFVLDQLGTESVAEPALRWIQGERVACGWGYCQRDQPSIPMTATVLWLLPALRDERSVGWLREAWSRDLASPVRLSYKGAWYLLGDRVENARPESEKKLRGETVEFLLEDQRQDGGWGPWRDHPAPTDCFATGLAMYALAKESMDSRIGASLKRGLEWCKSHRRTDGLFATHFIEEGSGWVLLGESWALRRLTDG
jgi:hypothetical protein